MMSLLLRRPIALAAPLALATLVACTEPLAPSELAGTYALHRIGDRSVPTVFDFGDAGLFRFVYDSLVLNSDGTARTATRYEQVDEQGAVLQTFAQAHDWLVSTDGMELILSNEPCPPGTICAAAGGTSWRFRVFGGELTRPGSPEVGTFFYEKLTAQ